MEKYGRRREKDRETKKQREITEATKSAKKLHRESNYINRK